MNEQNTPTPVVEMTEQDAQRLRQVAEQLGENGEVLLQTADTEQPVD